MGVSEDGFSIEILTPGSEAMDAAFRLRHEVFVDEQQVPVDMERDEYDPHALHMGLFDPTGALVGTLRMVCLADVGKVGRVAVRADLRNRGLGARLMTSLIEHARLRADLQSLFLHSQVAAVTLYRRLGFVEEGEHFEEAGIEHVAMRLPL